MSKIISKKICLLGEYGAGKTSLVRRFVHNLFSDDYITTIGVKVSEKLLPPIKKKDGKLHQLRFLIWDIAGSEEGKTKYENYWIGASGALIVADLCRPDTFIHSKSVLDQFLSINPDASIVIAGNKTDLITETEHSTYIESLRKISDKKKYPVLLTSAKTGLSVQKSFLLLAESMLD